MLNDVVTDAMSSVIENSISKVASSIISSNNWKKIFVESGAFIADFETETGSFSEAFGNAFSEENLLELARKYKGKSGYKLSDIEEDALDLLQSFGVAHDVAVSYSKKFMLVLMNRIQKDFPNQFSQYFHVQEFEEEKKALSQIVNMLIQVQKTLDKIRRDATHVLSLDEADQELRNSTQHPSIGVNFFESDDNEFRDRLKEEINKDILYVRGRCREETAYCVLYELRKLNPGKPIFIVRSKEDWEKLQRLPEAGNIFIADFYADEMKAIENNISVFIFNDSQKIPYIEPIQLRPRTFRTLIDLLKSAGLDADSARRLVHETHGQYISLKRRIFKGVINAKPRWVDELDERVLKTCLLLEQWTDGENDREIVEDLSGISFEEFDRTLQRYTHDEEPPVIIVRRNGGNYYTISSVENTWGYATVSTSESIWKLFVSWLEIVVSEPERLLILDTAQRFIETVKGAKLSYSREIREGMLNTLIVKACFEDDENCQYQLDQITREILECVDSVDKWDYISTFFTQLCEISPSVMLERLDQEFNQSTGLLDLFNRQSSDFIMGRNAYLQILFGVEQFLYQDLYKKQAIQWLLKLDNLSLKYLSNSPSNLLEKVFAPFGYFTAVHSVEERIALAEIALVNDQNGWNLLYRVASANSIMISPSAPRYRVNVAKHANSEILISDYVDTVKAYCSMLIHHLNQVPERYINLINISDEFDEETRTALFSAIEHDMPALGDEDVVKIKSSIREFIYRIRFFEQYNEVLTENVLTQYEHLLERMIVHKPELEYTYLFAEEIHFPLLHPVSIKDDDHYELNKKKQEELCAEKLIEFRNRKLDLRLLVRECGRLSTSTLGFYLGKVWDDGRYNPETFRLLLEEQPSGALAVGYCHIAEADNFEEKYRSAIAIAEASEKSAQTICNLYIEEAGEAIYHNSTPMIKDAEETIKEVYWKNVNSSYMPYTPDSWKWILPECRQYGCLETYVDLLHTGYKKGVITEDELYEALIGIDHLPVSSGTGSNMTMIDYNLSELLKILFEKFRNNSEVSINMVRIEIQYSRLLRFEHMPFYRMAINRDPALYTEVLNLAIPVRDDAPKPELCKEEQKQTEFFYELFHETKFCPGIIDGKVSNELLQAWVEKFRALMTYYHRTSQITMFLGRLFAYSPAGEDGTYLADAVCKMIETNYDKQLADEYICTTVNKRGMYTVNAGESEKAMAEKYHHYAEKLYRKGYGYTAGLYEKLSRQYSGGFEYERIAAENGMI